MSPIFAVIWGNIALWVFDFFELRLRSLGCSFLALLSSSTYLALLVQQRAYSLMIQIGKRAFLLFSHDGSWDMRTRAIWGFLVASMRDAFFSLEASVLSFNCMFLAHDLREGIESRQGREQNMTAQVLELSLFLEDGVYGNETPLLRHSWKN